MEVEATNNTNTMTTDGNGSDNKSSLDKEANHEKDLPSMEIQKETVKEAIVEPCKEKKAGYAAIKSEYMLHDYKPTLHSEYLSEQVKKKLSDVLSKDDSKSEETTLGKRPSVQDEDKDEEDDDGTQEPSHKKAKLKGRNKRRPQNDRIQEKDKMCPAIKVGKDCKFGDNCKFAHDKKEFFEKKLPDLMKPCPLFEQFGYCRSGITCRYAKSHLDENFDNIVNKDLYEKMKDSLVYQNLLSDDVKHLLWKRKFNFGKSMKIVKNVLKMSDSSNAKNPEKISDKKSESALPSTESTETNIKNEGASVDEIKSPPRLAEDGANTDCTSETKKEDLVNVDLVKSGQAIGNINDEEGIRLRPQEKKKIDFRNKLYLAPLTTVGNLPFRRVCKGLGADITCGEMALASQLLKGKSSEWSLIKRHPCEDLFGVQVCGAYPDMMAKCAQVLTETMNLDFIDINCGCPIDLIFRRGAGSALMGKAAKLEQISRSMIGVMDGMPLTVKIRTGVYDNKQTAHSLIPRLRDAGVSLVTLHGRSREQRYTRLADWEYVSKCAQAGDPMPVFGNGDILSYEDAKLHMQSSNVAGVMIARGALIKPWLFTELKEQRHWDISSNERLDILKSFTNNGLEHWGSDQQGVETTRRFLLEWLSFLYRYIPVGVLEQVPQRINERPPYYMGRNDLETLMASANCADWVKLSEMVLGPVPPSFKFLPKHKANAYQ